MKKVSFGFILGMIVCVGLQTIAATTSIFKAEKAPFDIIVNGNKFTDTSKPPVLIDGSTYLPLRSMGNVLNVPVEWNDEKRRVEVNMKSIEDLTAESKSLKLNISIEGNPVISTGGKYYVLLSVFAEYISSKMENDSNNMYLFLPNKTVLIKAGEGKTWTEATILFKASRYIDIEACGLKYTLDGDTLWIEV